MELQRATAASLHMPLKLTRPLDQSATLYEQPSKSCGVVGMGVRAGTPPSFASAAVYAGLGVASSWDKVLTALGGRVMCGLGRLRWLSIRTVMRPS